MWRVLKNNIFHSGILNIMILLEIMVFVICTCIFGSSIVKVEGERKYFNEEYNEFVYAEVMETETAFAALEKYGGEYGFYLPNAMLSLRGINAISDIEKIIAFDTAVAAHMRIQTDNDVWFSGEYGADYYEMIVSRKYGLDIGDTYELSSSFSTVVPNSAKNKIKVKIIGYMNDIDFGIYRASAIKCDAMLCAPFDLAKAENLKRATIVAFDGDITAVRNTFGNSVAIEHNFPFNELYASDIETATSGLYIIILITAIMLISIAANILISIARDKKRTAVNAMCGGRRSSLIIAEILQVIIVCAIGIILALIIFDPLSAGLTSATDYGVNLPLIAAIVAFVLYAAATSVKLVNVIMTKPLDILRRNDL